MRNFGEVIGLLSLCIVSAIAAAIPLSFIYVLVKGSWLVLKHVWLASW